MSNFFIDPSWFGGGSCPSPPVLANLFAWYDACDDSTITEDGIGITEWADKSGNNNHVTQSTDSLKPQYNLAFKNGRNTVQFNTNELRATITPISSWPVTVYQVLKKNGVSNSFGCFSLNQSSSGALYFLLESNGSDFRALIRNGSQALPVQAGYNSTDWFISDHYTWSNTEHGVAHNGNTYSTVSTNVSIPSMDTILLGNRRVLSPVYYDVDIGEVLVYEAEHTPTERTDIIDYLNDKWAVY